MRRASPHIAHLVLYAVKIAAYSTILCYMRRVLYAALQGSRGIREIILKVNIPQINQPTQSEQPLYSEHPDRSVSVM